MPDLIEKIREKAVWLNGTNDVADEILALVGDARFVLIGEASHGTHEFYKYRAEITKRLIIFSVFRCGCGAIWTWLISSSGSKRTTTD